MAYSSTAITLSKFDVKYSRSDSISVTEAVEDIQRKTGKRRDSCARAFADAILENMPEIEFWQFAPPDPEDCAEAPMGLDIKLARQVWPTPIVSTGHTIAHWLKDVYAGSRSKVQVGNKWDEPCEFNYRATSSGTAVPERVSELPMPLMRNFRANTETIRSIRDHARGAVKPKGKKSENEYTPFVDEAVRQVSERVKSKSEDDMRAAIETFGLHYPTGEITEIRFNGDRVLVEYETSSGSQTRDFANSVFFRKVRNTL